MPHFLSIAFVFCGLFNKVRSRPTCSSACCELRFWGVLTILPTRVSTSRFCRLCLIVVVVFTYFQLVPHGTNAFLLGKLSQLIPQSRWYGQTTDGNIMVLQNYGVCQRYLPRGGAELSRVATSLGSLVGWQVLLLQMLP